MHLGDFAGDKGIIFIGQHDRGWQRGVEHKYREPGETAFGTSQPVFDNEQIIQIPVEPLGGPSNLLGVVFGDFYCRIESGKHAP